MMRKFLLKILCFSFLINTAYAQSGVVSGIVTSEDDNQPLPGVSVTIKGTNIGVQTTSEGVYSIKNLTSNAVLVFSYIGYTGKEIAVSGKATINTTLKSTASELTEVVVTANAINREKKTLGYSAPVIKNDVLTEGANPSALNSLAGRVAGANITTTSNTPGSSSRVVLRGGSSIAGSNQALIVVDGTPIDNSSAASGTILAGVDFGNRGNDIDPDDIASVTVLKGPAAAALYGSRASNGALIITTKSGSQRANKTEITFNTQNTFSNILKLPDFQNEYGQGYYDEISEDGKSATFINDPKENWSWGAPFTGALQEWGQQIDGVRQIKPYSAQRDNVKNFFKTGFASDNNLSLSGGDEKRSFYLGINSLNSDGVYPGDKDIFNKYGVRFNGKANFDNNFYAGISVNYNKINSNTVGSGQGNNSVLNNVIQTPRDIPLDKLGDLNNKYNGYSFTDANGVLRDKSYGYYGAYTINPYWVIANYDNFNDVNRVTGNFNVGYKPTTWLDIQERVGIDSYSNRTRLLEPKFSFAPADEAGNYSAAANSQTDNGSYQISQTNVNEVVHDLMITGTHKFNDDFQASLLIGNNIRQRATNGVATATNASGGLVVPGLYNLSNSNGPLSVVDNISKRRLIGLYADLNLSYKEFLFLEATARNDWSSTLPKANNSFFYPSVSGSFVFSELLKNSSAADVLTYGKLRSSFAQVGSDTDPYQLLSTYARGTINGNFGSTVFPFGNVAALMAGATIGNANLKPEITRSFEVGTELGFFKDRLSVDFTYYINNSRNQILNIPIPNSTGYGFSVINAGEVENKGIELSLRGTPIKTTYGLTWELFGTFTKNNNKVVDLLDGVEQVVIDGASGLTVVAAKGRTYGEFYGVTTAKDAQGRTIVDSETGIPVNTSTAQYLGSYNPKYQASLGTNFKYKNVGLNVLFDVKQGGVFYSRTKDNMAFTGTSVETGGPRFGVIYPNSVYLDDNGNSVVNTTVGYNKQDYYPTISDGQNVVDGSFVKLRSAGISYQFNKTQLKSLPIGSLTLGLYGNNLFIWTPKENTYSDPEISSGGAGNAQGYDFSAQPSVRNYGFNIKASF